MEIERHRAAALGCAVKNGFPKIVVSLSHAAFAVRADGHPANGRTGLQQRAQGVAAVWRLRLGREPFDAVVGIRTVGPNVSVRPQSELKPEPEARGLVAGETQHGKILVAFFIRQRRGPHAVSGNVEKKGIGKVKVAIGDIGGEIVAQAQREAEAVEALGREHRQVAAPKFLVVKPALVLDVAGKGPPDGTHGVGGSFDRRF